MAIQTSVTSAPNQLMNSAAVIDEIAGSLRATAEEVVPWFLECMPPMYFQDTKYDDQMSHLRAIIASKASGRPLEMTLRSKDGSQWTMMRPLDYPGVLSEMVAELPRDRPLRAAKIHTANDSQLVLDTFLFGEGAPFNPSDPEQAAKREEVLEYAARNKTKGEPTADQMDNYLQRCSEDYVMSVTAIRMCRHWKLYQQVSGTDGSAVSLEPESDPNYCRIVLAVSNATTRTMFERLVTRLSASAINIHRAYLDTIRDDDGDWVVLLGFVVTRPGGGIIEESSELWQSVRGDLQRMKWLDERTLKLAYAHHDLGLSRAEVIVALGDLVHQTLIKSNPYAFSTDRIGRLMQRNLKFSTRIADLFIARFKPDSPMPDADFHTAEKALREEIANEVDLEDARTVLKTSLDAVCAVMRTNYHLPARYGLALRIDPKFLVTPERSEVPYGVFFVHGRAFIGFHVRFRDIARGGIRAVRPLGLDQHAREVERLYDEAYGLAHAQQLKNKDIPEGGAKAAILLEPDSRVDRSVKGFVDSVLDLITPDPAVRKRIVDRFGQEELLYFGPDENITPRMIEWIVKRAKQRGYPTPTALMSSKPGAGINHKQYGVTSEGVNVFLAAALRSVGIDPDHQNFTIKMTGGPDGDVGGNMIRILERDYRDRARIIGIADGSGAGEDPDGLNHDELMRLFRAGLPIGHFDRAKLSPNGRIATLDEPDGVHLRNTLHNRLVADAFVPCGGRPNAIHAGNWRDYLQKNGTPSSKVIVEGANLFLTPDARNKLSECGVLIMKDSSANKCGVITSSFEIAACMMLNDEAEFLQIKDRFVEEVLVRLRDLARHEAELLGRVHRHRSQVPLPVTSIMLSRVMIRTADAIEAAIDTMPDSVKEKLRTLVIDHLPPVLVERAGQRLWNKTPARYLKWMMAKSLAARIVYRDGFEYLESMSSDAIANLAVRYLDMDLERKRLIDSVGKSSLPERQRIVELLAHAGILSTLGGE